MKEEIQAIFEQEMSRREFLQYAGSVFLLAIGVTSLVKALRPAKRQVGSALGYGASAYGGARK